MSSSTALFARSASSLFPRTSAAIGVVAFGLVARLRVPAPAVILLGGAAGVAAGALRLA